MSIAVSLMVGLTPTKVERSSDIFNDYFYSNEKIIFHFDDDVTLVLTHEQSCCEDVTLEDVVGDLNDLVGHPLLVSELRTTYEAEEARGLGDLEEYELNEGDVECIKRTFADAEAYEWAFYEFRNIKSSVTLRYVGESTGYYSTDVNFFVAINDKLHELYLGNFPKDFLTIQPEARLALLKEYISDQTSK